MAEVVQLLVSPVHRFEGRPTADLPAAPDETVDTVEIRARLGIVGDRYFNRPAHRDAAVTILAAESVEQWGADLRQLRRNILLRGVDVDSAAGRVLSLDTGDGPVLLRLTRRAAPCGWLDQTVAPGARTALRGRGGMRCEPLNDGVLRVGEVTVEWLDSNSDAGPKRQACSGA